MEGVQLPDIAGDIAVLIGCARSSDCGDQRRVADSSNTELVMRMARFIRCSLLFQSSGESIAIVGTK